MTRRLERRLQTVFRDAAAEAARNHRKAIERLRNFEQRLSSGMWGNMSEADINNAKRNYLLRIDRAKGISRNIATDLANSGETASRMIQNEALNTFDASYRATVTNISGQLPRNAQASINWNMYNRNHLKALLMGDVPGISRSPFTQIAFNNLSNPKAVQRMTERLQEMFAASIASGDATFRTLTQKIRAVTGFELNRCRTIARTEGARVHNQGRYLAAEQARQEYDIPTVKIWEHIPVAAVPREVHMDMDGTQADEDGYFNVNGHRALYPLDPNLPPEESINCHCIVTYRVLREDGRGYGEKIVDSNLDFCSRKIKKLPLALIIKGLEAFRLINKCVAYSAFL